ncbi:MAG: birA, biotin-(acetyl-CoA-carboxylase) ligase [Actinomycetia bacterium]|nr:birA, biotin-(acetyl-CoA-carboxylase) ligase [Actinomycetes bacterium]
MELVEEVDSTNRELLRRAEAGAPAGIVLVAGHQTAGRGRRDRRWESPPGASLLVSVLLRPTVPAEQLHLITFAAGLAAKAAAEAVAGVRLGLKWPNDVVVDESDGARKVAGLLAESVVEGGAVAALVVGMGLNVNWDADVPDGGAALNQLAGGPVDRDRLLTAWLDRFGGDLDRLETASGRAHVLDRYRSACATIGRQVRVETAEGAVEGPVTAVDGRGHLVLGPPVDRSFAVGDVVHLRGVSAPGPTSTVA